MTQPRTKAARWDNTLLNQGTAPPSTSRVLAPAAPLEEQRGSYCSKEELSPTTAAASATAYRSTEGLEGTSPPITLVSLARTLMDPPNAASTDDLRGDDGAHPQPRTPSPGAASGGRGESSGVASDAAGPLPCPRVPPMVLTLLVATALVQGFSASAISLFINMELKLGPVEVARYWMYIGYTAWCQPAIGYLSDALVLCGEKRRPLFVLAALGNTVIFLLYCATPQVTSSYGSFVAMSLCSQFFTMGLYIPLNGLVVEVGRHDAESAEESMARMSAIMAKTMVWRSTGSLIGNILQAFLVLRLSVPALLGVTGGLFALLVPIVLFTPRKLFLRAGTRSDNFYKRVAEAARLVYRSFDIHDVRSDGVCFLLVLAFVFVYTLMPDASSVYYNYLYGAYTFPTWFYALNNCIGYVGSIAGAYVFSLWMDHRARQEARGGKRTSLFFIFMIGSFAWAFGYVTNLLLCTGVITNSLGISAALYVPVDTFFVSMFVRFAFMPTLTMAAEHAPKFFEATTFEVFSVASIGGGTISSLLTSIMAQELGIRRTDYSRLWILIVVSIALKLVPIPLAYLLPERRTGVVEQPTIEDGDAGSEENAAGVPVGGRLRQLMESARVSGESGDDDDPSMPLNGRHRNLI